MLPIFVWKREKYLNVPFFFPIFAQMYRFYSPPPFPPNNGAIYTSDLKVTCIFSEGYRRYLALCLTSYQFVSAFLFFVYIARLRTSSYGVARLVQISPLNCWRNATPFLCKASFCTMKNDHFRARAIDHLVLFFWNRCATTQENWDGWNFKEFRLTRTHINCSSFPKYVA